MPTCPSTPADMPASSFSPFSPGSSCFQPDSEPPSLLLPGGPPGCQDPISSTHRSPSPGGPSCRQTVGVRPVPTSLLPGTCLGPGRLPSSCSFPGSLTRPGWLTPAMGSPCPGCLRFSGRGQSGERTYSPGRVFLDCCFFWTLRSRWHQTRLPAPVCTGVRGDKIEIEIQDRTVWKLLGCPARPGPQPSLEHSQQRLPPPWGLCPVSSKIFQLGSGQSQRSS